MQQNTSILKNTPMEALYSNEDASVNFVWRLQEKEAIEARFVQRDESYFICYLSSQTGCNQSCRFCHLTATKQTSFKQAGVVDFLIQAQKVFDHYDNRLKEGMLPVKRVHFNWMARGEPLLNPNLIENWKELRELLFSLCAERNLEMVLNLSTIFPKSVDLTTLEPILTDKNVNIFYSLYSLDESFRKKWIPKSKAPLEVLDFLETVQKKYGTKLTFRWALISGQNDSEQTIEKIVENLKNRELNVKFNLVRYNPYSEAQGKESSEVLLNERFNRLLKVVNAKTSRIVPRVGFDVKASCGMFI